MLSEIKQTNNNFYTAVLFIVFNRLDCAREVFEQIKIVKPPRLYIASDAPRDNKLLELESVEKVRKYVLESIDWDCEIFTLFGSENLGPGKFISKALTWFFEHEEMGIILEEDCVPSQSFFWFSQEMLVRYKDDYRISMICGTNYNSDIGREPYYFLSRNFTVWGWASYRRVWRSCDQNMIKWKNGSIVADDFEHLIQGSKSLYQYTFDLVKYELMDTWDIALVFTCLSNYSLSITPSVNLVTNIGIVGAYSDKKSNVHFIKNYEMNNLNTIKLLDKNFLPNKDYERFIERIDKWPKRKQIIKFRIKLMINKLRVLKQVFR